MINANIGATVPLHIAFALEKEAEKNHVSISKMLKIILTERYAGCQNEEDYLAMLAELEMEARRRIDEDDEVLDVMRQTNKEQLKQKQIEDGETNAN